MPDSYDLDSYEKKRKVADKKRIERARIGRRVLLIKRGLLVAVGVLALMIVFLSVDGFQNVSKAELKKVYQRVWHTGSDENTRMAARVNDSLHSQDHVITEDDSRASIVFPDDTTIKVGPKSNFRVLYNDLDSDAGAKRRWFQLASGRIWTRVTKFFNAKSEFRVDTPTAQAAVRGTRFSVLVLPDGTTTISVKDGKVAVTILGTNPLQVVLLLAGQQITVPPRPSPNTAAVAISAEEEAEWQAQQTDSLGAASDVLAQPSSSWRSAMLSSEEQALVGPISAVGSFVHIPGFKPRKLPTVTLPNLPGVTVVSPEQVNYLKARTAAEALQKALATAEDPTSGFPPTVELDTLAGLTGDQKVVAAILNNTEGHKLLKYEKKGETYTAELRAKAPCKAVIRITPAKIITVSGAP